MKSKKIEVFTGKDENLEDSKHCAIHEFYQAFNSRSLELMQKNWSHSDMVCMANPIGGIRRGWKEIEEGYRKIFGSNHRVYVELYDFQFISTNQMFVINGRERGTLQSGNKELELKIRTSRIYQLEGATWKQVVHHGSMDDPEHLKEYQKIILNK